MTDPLVLIVRHGETDWNTGGPGGVERLRGHEDIPLNREGRKEADRLAAKLASVPIADLYSSDLIRAYETARVIGLPHLTPQATQALRPWNLGDLQGQPVSEVLKPMLAATFEHPEQAVPGGESFATFARRFTGFLAQVMQEAQQRPGAVVLVSHTRDQRMADSWIKGGMSLSTLARGPLRAAVHLKTGEILALTHARGTWTAAPWKLSTKEHV